MGSVREGRVWFEENRKYGFADESGEVVIAAVYDEASDFHEGRAIAKRGSLYGFVDPEGHEVIPVELLHVSVFERGRALVMFADRRCGFVDRDGTLLFLTACQFEDARYHFADDRVAVKRAGRWGFMDRDGNEAVPCRYDEVGLCFRNGFARVRIGELWGAVDVEGREVVPCRYASLEDFGASGLARVGDGRGYGLVDGRGREIVPCRYAYVADRFVEERCHVCTGAVRVGDEFLELHGFVDPEGHEVIPPRFQAVADFVDGRARVCLRTNEGGLRSFFVDRFGNELPSE